MEGGEFEGGPSPLPVETPWARGAQNDALSTATIVRA